MKKCLFENVCSTLDRAKVPYAIVGGYAVDSRRHQGNCRCRRRYSMVARKYQKQERAFKAIGLVSLLPITAETLFHFKDEYIQQRNLIAWNFYDPSNPLNQVDIVINYDLKGAHHTKKVQTALGTIPILSLNELIKMKEASGRPQDLEDVKALKSL